MKDPEEMTFAELTAHLPNHKPGTMQCRGPVCAHFRPNTRTDYDLHAIEDGEEEAPETGDCASPEVAAMDTDEEPGGRMCPHYTPTVRGAGHG